MKLVFTLGFLFTALISGLVIIYKQESSASESIQVPQTFAAEKPAHDPNISEKDNLIAELEFYVKNRSMKNYSEESLKIGQALARYELTPHDAQFVANDIFLIHRDGAIVDQTISKKNELETMLVLDKLLETGKTCEDFPDIDVVEFAVAKMFFKHHNYGRAHYWALESGVTEEDLAYYFLKKLD